LRQAAIFKILSIKLRVSGHEVVIALHLGANDFLAKPFAC